MADKTSIQWTDATWSPIAAFRKDNGKRGWHCEKVSGGCKGCYAEKLNGRLGTHLPYTPQARDLVEIRAVNLDVPLRWRRPRRIFVESMSDLFADFVPDALIDRVFAVMALAPQHMFQVLTKRPERMRAYVASRSAPGESRARMGIALGAHPRDLPKPRNGEPGWQIPYAWPLPNVWLGVSVEDAEHRDRIDVLRRVPAAVRFVSFEPLLGDLRDFAMTGIAWAIFGGESGPSARPCHVSWIRSGMATCRHYGTAVFVKQFGARPYDGLAPDHNTDGADEPRWWKLRDRKGGDMSEWPEDLRVREFPAVRP